MLIMAYFDERMDFPDLSKVRDRGSKKLVAIMLPEHVKMIRDYNEEVKKVPRPQLNEWDVHAIEETLQIAIKRKCTVILKMWKEGQIYLSGGTIESVDLKRRTLELDDPFGLRTFNLDEIVDITEKE